MVWDGAQGDAESALMKQCAVAYHYYQMYPGRGDAWAERAAEVIRGLGRPRVTKAWRNQRRLAALAEDPCNPWQWYEATKVHECQELTDLRAICGSLVDDHLEAALSGLGLYIDQYQEARYCSPHLRFAPTKQDRKRQPIKKQEQALDEHRGVVEV